MSDKVKISAIIGVSAILCVGLVTYCSPYQTCIREQTGKGNEGYAASYCGNLLTPN